MGSRPLAGRYTLAVTRNRACHRRAGAVWVLALLALSGCGEALPHSAANIESAVESYLSENTDLRLHQMSVRADRIRYDGDRAVASVSIVAADDPKAAMKMIYELVREEGVWRVVPAAAASSHEGGVPSSHGQPSDLPPGHPPIVPQDGGLPPGHPPLAEGPE